MRFDRDFLTSPTGQIVLVVAVLLLGVIAVRSQHKAPAPALPPAKPAPAELLPRILTRDGAKIAVPPAPPTTTAPVNATAVAAKPPTLPPVLPLALFAAPRELPAPPAALTAPFGRLIPCRTVLALESNRLETPIIGLVTADVWHDGKRIIPAGAEVHGRATLDRARERIGAQGAWRIVWRTQDGDNGTELAVDGLVLDREVEADTGSYGDHDGSAGLRGQVVKTGDERELKLFAATFLATATSALQDNRLTAGLLGESSVPAATARNAVLAGTGAVLRDYAQRLREAIAQDGFYLRVPAGKAFYLYVTQTLDRGQARRASPLAPAAPSHP
jgi:hypothetical protein